MKGDDKTIRNVKFILYYFEWMSRLKINYHKSEVFTVGMSDGEMNRIENMLHCKIGSFPFIYLGIHVSDSHLV